MRRRLFFWEAGGFLFVAVLGTLLHFVYDWSGESAVAAAFSGVNESTWEHMKLLFFPIFFYSLVQMWFTGRNYPNFPAVRAVSTLAGLALIPTLFYTYTGILGYRIDWVNIAIFFVAALTTFILDRRLLAEGRMNTPWLQMLGLAILWALAFLFVWCTFRPVQLALWQDPITGDYGIP